MTEAEKRAQIIASQAQREAANPRIATTKKAKGAARPPVRPPGRFPTRISPDTDEKKSPVGAAGSVAKPAPDEPSPDRRSST